MHGHLACQVKLSLALDPLLRLEPGHCKLVLLQAWRLDLLLRPMESQLRQAKSGRRCSLVHPCQAALCVPPLQVLHVHLRLALLVRLRSLGLLVLLQQAHLRVLRLQDQQHLQQQQQRQVVRQHSIQQVRLH